MQAFPSIKLIILACVQDVEARRPTGTRVRIEIPYRAALETAEAIPA